MFFLAAALIGLIAAIPVIMWSRHQASAVLVKAAGWGLVVAASVYFFASLNRADGLWKIIELMGIGLYGCFYWMARKQPLKALAWGWGLHPVWDIFLHWLGPGSYIMPAWYAIACAVFDGLVALYLWWRHTQEPQRLSYWVNE